MFITNYFSARFNGSASVPLPAKIMFYKEIFPSYIKIYPSENTSKGSTQPNRVE